MDVTILVAKYANITYEESQTITKLFDEDATIPFLSRYRKNLIGDLTSEDLRFIKQTYQLAKSIKAKADFIKKKIRTKGELTDQLESLIDSAQSLPELDDLYAPYKTAKKCKSSILKEIGFDKNAENLLFGHCRVCPENIINPSVELINDTKCVNEMLILLLTELMMADKDLQKTVSDLVERERIFLVSKQKSSKVNKKSPSKLGKQKSKEKVEKFENYYKYRMPYKYVKPHQILALNRGEKKKMLSVKMDFPQSFEQFISRFAMDKWLSKGLQYAYRSKMLQEGIKCLLKNKIIPRVTKSIRASLTLNGEKAALDVFSSNLKWLLLSRPILAQKNYVVLSIDPGFKNGCKLAVVNINRDVLDLKLLHLNRADVFKMEVKNLIDKHNIQTIAIGNGTGCREVELIVSSIITQFDLKVKYVIVSEQGVSVYSCSPEAVAEYPDLEPNFISAISLAKRHLDPLSELIKVDPQHLGVGMYQHDMDQKKLGEELTEVVSECVSEVGVDINTAPLVLLKRVAGLSDSKAKKIIEARDTKGGFLNRKEILDIKGIGPKTYEQCAGFIKVNPETSQSCQPRKRAKFAFNPLDQTIIHPDDYDKATAILKLAKLNIEELGSPEFVRAMRGFQQQQNIKELAESLSIPETIVNLICEAFSTPLGYDIRSSFSMPLFKTGFKSIDDVCLGSVLTGRVENVTPFGAFVDVGLENSGLIPSSLMNNCKLHLGQRVSVRVNDKNRGKIGLKLLNILADC